MNDDVDSNAWQPSASIAMLKRRAELLIRIRQFFFDRGVLEVETPILSHYGNPDPHIESFTADHYYLHTSPEFAMKRLLAAGAGSIYQICKVFRKDEAGSRHNPEFTMLEWYREGFSYHDLMDEIEAFLRAISAYTSSKKLTYGEIFERYLSLDIFNCTVVEMRQCAEDRGVVLNDISGMDEDAWRDLLLSYFIEPELGKDEPVFVYDFPASQAALAQISTENPAVAERFELYINGVEIANGYQELLDPLVQQERWQRENARRQQQNLTTVPYDKRMVAALESGISACAGVALGVDRLLMVLNNEAQLSSVLSFSDEKA